MSKPAIAPQRLRDRAWQPHEPVNRASKQIDRDFCGYRVIDVPNRGAFFAHDLCYFDHTGQWPRSPLIHRDGNRANNHFANLQERDHSEPLILPPKPRVQNIRHVQFP